MTRDGGGSRHGTARRRSQASTIRLALQPLQILPPPPELLPPPVPPRDEEVVVELPAAGGVLVGEGVEGDGTGVGAGGEGGVGAVVAVQAAVVSLAGDQIKSNQLSTYPSEMLGTGGKMSYLSFTQSLSSVYRKI